MFNRIRPVSLEGYRYNGINFLLLQLDYPTPVWGTFNQVRKNGGHVLKGEKATPVVFWQQLAAETVRKFNKKTGKTKDKDEQHWMLRYYWVFNVAQCEFDEKGNDKIKEMAGLMDNKTDQSADEIISCFIDPPSISNVPTNPFQTNPHYSPTKDSIYVPEITSFVNTDQFYATLFHELVHATGHKSRLDRLTEDHDPDRHEYSKEELVAELGSAFLTSLLGLNPSFDNYAAYINGWSGKLQDNTNWIIWAASRAERAVEFILDKTRVPQAELVTK